MKGLVEKSSDGIFLQIKHGGIVRESKHPQEGFEPIEVTNIRTGAVSTKFIKRYRGVEALVKKIEWYDREYDGTPYQGWKLLLDADGTICTLDIPFDSRVGSRFMKIAENIDYSLPVEFSAWKGTDDKTAFAVKQNGENIPQKYSRENPGDCPEPTQGFNKKWNYDAQKQFLHTRMVKVVIPMVQAANPNGHVPEEAKASEPGRHSPEALLESIKKNLVAATQVENETRDRAQLLEDYFGTRVWADVEKMPTDVLKTAAQKLEDDLIPF